MKRLYDGLVLASSNPGKIREVSEMLAGLSLTVAPQSQFQVSDADETGLTFVENAILKARHAALRTGLPAIADDSGLVVDALQGAPGIYSARYAGVGATDEANLQKVLSEIRDIPSEQRTARFVCVLVCMLHPLDPTPIVCEGTWEGTLVTTPVGQYGFGYDPIFWVPTHHCTSAELLPAVKNALSHRGQALRSLLAALRTRGFAG